MMASHSPTVAGPICSASRREARRRPVGVSAMALGMCSAIVVWRLPQRRAGMAGNPLAAMEHLDGRAGDAHLDHLADQRVRHGVQVAVATST